VLTMVERLSRAGRLNLWREDPVCDAAARRCARPAGADPSVCRLWSTDLAWRTLGDGSPAFYLLRLSLPWLEDAEL
jgi:hypothetical protein